MKKRQNNSARPSALQVTFLVALLSTFATFLAIAAPTTLWYNGDWDGFSGLYNGQNSSLGSGQYASIYEDFNVTDPNGWDVTSVFSDNALNTNVTGANWSIRQGISEGNGGITVASGTTMTPTLTATGRSGFGFTEYMVEVTGLSVHLAPGTYWLNVTPIGDLTGDSYDTTTSGANCVGTPCGNNQNAFFDSNFFGANFTSTANIGQFNNFSMGVNGSVSGGIQVSQITPTGTTCSQFVSGTAQTLDSLQYSLKNGVIKQVNPGVFFYWVGVTAPAGNNTFSITQAITIGNFNTFFDIQGGSNVFDSNCVSLHPSITHNGGTVTVTFNAPTAGTYFIGIKYSANGVVGSPAPSPGTTVHYDFMTPGVPGSISGLDLVVKN